MAGVRRVTRAILRYAFPLYVVLIVLQVYLAGEGIFGDRDKEVIIKDGDSLSLHRDFGFIIAQPLALLLLIVVLLAWLPNTRLRVLSILFPILLIVQSLLPPASRWIAALHPVNAFVLLALAGYLSMVFWKRRAEVEEPAQARAMTTEERPAAETV